MDDFKEFDDFVADNIKKLGQSEECKKLSKEWLSATGALNYSFNFQWMGMPVLQQPVDLIAMQELIWNIKPDLIIETGVARGGSVIFYASMLEMMQIEGDVLGIDIDIRAHNFGRIMQHPMKKRITLLEGSSTSDRIIDKVKAVAENKERVLVVFDSNHSHEHVLKELELYTPFVSKGSYCVVFDTIVEDLADSNDYSDRPWGKGNNPKTAVWEFLKNNSDFVIDTELEGKLQTTICTDGFLKRIA
ncbi:cephalosporin hydroxylase family protein [Maridesulfovibrio sp.]|uniref:cephalosporin hydroxylase family protein n=1 Tax=Maridesulfovibrio sp. TaxID=2795000 RepID=UPI0029F58D8D|nr:cephalosporin hydroxylase family protein [Maridesulfovibrio sp.]